MSIIKGLPEKMKSLAVLKYHCLRIQSDDLTKHEKDAQHVEDTVQKGFEELFASKKTRAERKKEIIKLKKQKRQGAKEERSMTKKELVVYQTLEKLDEKLFGLLVPQAGNFLPDFFEMVRLMVSIHNPVAFDKC